MEGDRKGSYGDSDCNLDSNAAKKIFQDHDCLSSVDGGMFRITHPRVRRFHETLGISIDFLHPSIVLKRQRDFFFIIIKKPNIYYTCIFLCTFF